MTELLFDRDAAIRQYDKDVKLFQDTIATKPDEFELVKAVMDLRKLDQDQRYEVEKVLCFNDDQDSVLRRFANAIDPAEHLSLPYTLVDLIGDIWFNICDDGFLALCRLDVEDDIESFQLAKFPGTEPVIRNFRRDIIHFLTISPFHDDMDGDHPAVRWKNRHHGMYAYVNPVIRSFDYAMFSTIQNFTSFIRIFSNPGIWDKKYNSLQASSFIDALFFNKEK
jgi:hypothetical protein